MQFNSNFDGDSITIYNVNRTDGSPNLIVRLSGTDYGPKSIYSNSNWEEKVFSASANNIMVEFKSDNELEYKGFSATIRFTLLNNTKCESWMDMNNKIMQSPNYPNSYGSNMFCKYLITVQPNFHITLDFLEFDVSFFNHCNMILPAIFIITYFIQLEEDKDFLCIYEGGSEKGEMIVNMTGKKSNTQISIPTFQLFVIFHTDEKIEASGFNAKILEGMC